MDNDKIKEYDSAMLISTPSAAQLCEMMKSMILNTPYFMSDSTVHLAIEYFKASFKKDIEMNVNLSDDDKDKQKGSCRYLLSFR
ncbi:hypothetical protein [Prevotella lacticifex]|uniref:Uncharacterized protein n=1 Tax=Prevotella lacticifex TaxID=2854755 RepID=A0A9R1C7M6_9BACT|nr:hypothetical protein [Prevotella lacticifex]GJG37246.1 hypothetical protein PRLR5003_24030 [Prevotella lacticifex]GJG40254.1 hypothetical protein PRLR5019_22250 [Prevotella lacticifex]GJG43948.1 hypothetical protein PRLR5025_27340 [Prevotella lacticifex]GJG46632.1 hypothetical protein PRLR5027_22270 [Prevotella lacticifex]GJG50748.1 hypothetical protein PRLR5052_31610 [Prevotella lacticifex]